VLYSNGVFDYSAGTTVSNISTYDGLPLTATSVIVKYSYLGDADLDGKLTTTDLVGFLEHTSTGQYAPVYDVNFDGNVDSADWTLFLASYQNYLAHPIPLSGGATSGSGGGSGGAVPEPAGVAMVGAGLAMLGRRRR
jgi:hypothetical protein